MNYVLPFVLIFMTAIPLTAQHIGQPLTVWQPSQLDIHQISTGQGNATFMVLPDGTTLLLDAGAINKIDWRTGKPRTLPSKPDSTRQPGEWIAWYIRKTLRFQKNPVIDYALLTHFHDDHIGSPLNVTRQAAGGYVATGITEVAEFIPIRKLIDRGWPDYGYPRPFAPDDSMMVNYRRFLDWQVTHKGLVVERFRAGHNDQITLLNTPTAYKNQFGVRNLLVNGELWTGQGQTTRSLFPPLDSLKPAQYPNENMCSATIQIRYGSFTYFSGGDLPGVLQFGEPAWHDVETPLAAVAGPVDVHLLDHHGYADSENGTLLAKLRPRVLIIPAWATSHPAPDVLARIYDEQLYPGKRDVFTTSLLDQTRNSLGTLANRLSSTGGHVVIRVERGGKTYRVFVLDDTDELQRVKQVFGPYRSR